MKLPKYNPTTIILWIVYICLLLVLLPHTAWAFQSMEPTGQGGKFTAWVAAIAFEASIAVMTHKLSKHMETAKGRGWKRFSHMYLNAFAFGLLASTLISALANLAHAVQFGTTLKIFTDWGIPPAVYSVAFGGILPIVSLLFARVLSNVTESEDAANPELEKANTTIRELTKRAKEAEQMTASVIRSAEQSAKDFEARIRSAEAQAKTAEDRFGAMADLVKGLMDEDKRNRILTVKQWRPQLSGNAIAVITETSPAYVSEVLNGEVVEAK